MRVTELTFDDLYRPDTPYMHRRILEDLRDNLETHRRAGRQFDMAEAYATIDGEFFETFSEFNDVLLEVAHSPKYRAGYFVAYGMDCYYRAFAIEKES